VAVSRTKSKKRPPAVKANPGRTTPAADLPPGLVWPQPRAKTPTVEAPAVKLPAAKRPLRTAAAKASAAAPVVKVPTGKPVAAKVPPGKTAGKLPAGKAVAAKVPAEAEPEDLPGWAVKTLEKVLTVTYWLDPGEQGDPFSATIYFSSRRAEVTGKPRPGDTFSHEETVDGILPGSGPVAITAEIHGVNPGQWGGDRAAGHAAGSRPSPAVPAAR
jgi:hypothetical protein